jgi:S-DNA-T family DNA segregation ATPase FtsK/SpoIIIE
MKKGVGSMNLRHLKFWFYVFSTYFFICNFIKRSIANVLCELLLGIYAPILLSLPLALILAWDIIIQLYIQYANDTEELDRVDENKPTEKEAKTYSKFFFPIGVNEYGKSTYADIRKAPHLLIGGGSDKGKSVCLDNIIYHLIKIPTHYCQIILVDFKKVTFTKYNRLPHLLYDLVTSESQIIQVLNFLIKTMEDRQRLFVEQEVENIKEYNKSGSILPYIFLIIDEIGEMNLNYSSSTSKSYCEKSLIRLAAMARAFGIHLIIATQRPDRSVIDPRLKANLLSGIAFACKNEANSRILIDQPGAEKLEKPGDLILSGFGYSFLRLRGTFISKEEIKRSVTEVSANKNFRHLMRLTFSEEASDGLRMAESSQEGDRREHDRIVEAIQVCKEAGVANVNLLREHFHVGSNTATNMLNEMEKLGVVTRNGNKRTLNSVNDDMSA